MTEPDAGARARPATLVDGVRLALGTLSIIPVRPPGTVDRRSGGWAMTCAPLVGLLLAAAVTALLWLLGYDWFGRVPSLPELVAGSDVLPLRAAGPMLAATLAIALLALLTRGIHLDGLADTADGLGSGRPAPAALAIMRKSDVGPFGVATLVLVLLTQVAALSQHLADGRGPLAITLALVVSRLVLPVVCLRGVPAARNEGLGQVVAGSVSLPQLLLAGAASVGLLVLAVTGLSGYSVVSADVLVRGAAVALVAMTAGVGLGLWCLRRLGGVTGDVLGACVEVTFTVALVVLTLVR